MNLLYLGCVLFQLKTNQKLFQNQINEIHKAACHGNVREFQLLLDRYSLIISRDPLGCTPLHKSVLYGHFDLSEFIASNFAPNALYLGDNVSVWVRLFVKNFPVSFRPFFLFTRNFFHSVPTKKSQFFFDSFLFFFIPISTIRFLRTNLHLCSCLRLLLLLLCHCVRKKNNRFVRKFVFFCYCCCF